MVAVLPPMQFPQSWEGFGPKMQALSERERRFVWAYLMNGMTDGRENATKASRDAGYTSSPGSDRVQAHALLHRQRVLEAMQEVAGRELRGLVVPAVTALGRLLRNDKHPDHFKSAVGVLDRVGHGPRSALDVNVGGQVTVNHTDAALNDLRRLKALGVPQEKLEELFGYSGLARYERMLVTLPAPKVIEGEVADGQ